MLFARLAGCRYGLGFEISQRALFLREQALYTRQMQESRRIYGSIAPELRLPPFEEVLLPIAEKRRSEIAALLLREGIAEGEQLVVVHVGAKRHTNQWPTERFARVADQIIGRWGTRVILTGSSSERPMIERVAELMHERPVLLCGLIDLQQMPALLERSSLYVGNDTGPMHIAAAVGTPTISIFSARDFPQRWHPAVHASGRFAIGSPLASKRLKSKMCCLPCGSSFFRASSRSLRGSEVEICLPKVAFCTCEPLTFVARDKITRMTAK
jgi:ADP-heptose:LPS heptosyltransferase